MATFTTQPDAAAGKDTTVVNWDALANYGIKNHLMSANQKGLIEFDCSSIPAGSICNSATLSLYQTDGGAAPAAFTLTAYSIAVGNAAWIEGTKDATQAGAGEPCWNALAADGAGGVTTAWAGAAGLATSGTDYEATALGTANGNRSDPDGTEYAIALTAARVAGWFGASNTNYGMLILTSAHCGNMGTSDHANAARRPKLVIDYTLPNSNMRTPFWGRW